MAYAHPVAWAILASGVVRERDRATGEIVERTGWSPAPHLVWLTQNYLLPLERGEIRRLVVSMPPRHGKSTLITSYFLAWWLGRNPTHRAAAVSYGVGLAQDFGRLARDSLALYGQEVFGATCWARAKVTDWKVKVNGRNTGGGMLSLGREGAFTGKGANVLVGDDMIKGPEEANSARIRDQTWDWWTSVALTRLEPDAAVLLPMTRWHHDDIAARTIAASTPDEPVTVVNLPCIADSNEDPLGRAVGEVLWPDRWSLSWALRKRDSTPSLVWEALYQGRPTPRGGSTFLQEWIKTATVTDHYVETEDGKRVLKADLIMFGTADLAVATKEYADYSAMCAWGMDPKHGDLYLLHVDRGRWGGPEILRRMRELVGHWKLRALYTEYTAFHKQLGEIALQQGIPLSWVKADADKQSRSVQAAVVMQHGRLYLAKGARWLPMFVAEVLQFPAGRDDLVDNLSYAARIFLQHLEAWYDEDHGDEGLGGRVIPMG